RQTRRWLELEHPALDENQLDEMGRDRESEVKKTLAPPGELVEGEAFDRLWNRTGGSSGGDREPVAISQDDGYGRGRRVELGPAVVPEHGRMRGDAGWARRVELVGVEQLGDFTMPAQ